jgi:PKD repeat protein
MLGRPQDACAGSPSRVTEGLTVGSTTSSDSESSFSNYGTCVDILAPGSSITSAWYTGDGATNTISGTSMATPHVVGAAALYLAANSSASPTTVASALTQNASANKIKLHSRSTSGGTPNLLLYTAFIGSGGGTTNSPPTASFTKSCTDLTCKFTDTSTDSDGKIASWSWNFGDGSSSTETNPSRTYAAGGTYTVALTVTDDKGATGITSQTVTVSSSTTEGITLSATSYKVKGSQAVDLTWSGANGTNVDVFRSSTKISVPNSGSYTDNINAKGGGSYTYKVCETGSTTACSKSVTVTF